MQGLNRGDGTLPIVEVRTVIVQPKYKSAPIWKWVGKRFAAIACFDAGTLVVGAELLEAGVLVFIGPFAVAVAHVRRQAEAFAELDAPIAKARSESGQ